MNGVKIYRVCSKHHDLLLGLQTRIRCSRSVHNENSDSKTPVKASAVEQSETIPSTASRSEYLPKTETVEVEPTIFETGRSSKDVSTHQLFTYDVRKVDPTTVKQIYFFDTLGLVKILQNNGFTRQQAEGMSQSLVEVINTTLDHQGRHMVTKSQQEITVQQLMSEISSVKKDMVILQRSEFSSLRNETEKQTFEIRQIKDNLRDEIAKLKGQMTLDINLERSRAVEAHAENQKNLLKTNQKIETEVAHLRTIYEQYRNDVFKYAGGTVLTCAGLCLGIMRMWN